jgi:hypothetical protein
MFRRPLNIHTVFPSLLKQQQEPQIHTLLVLHISEIRQNKCILFGNLVN